MKEKDNRVAVIVHLEPEALLAIDQLAAFKTRLGSDREEIILSLVRCGVTVVEREMKQGKGKRA